MTTLSWSKDRQREMSAEARAFDAESKRFQPFTSRFDGRCCWCLESYKRGTPIRRSSKGYAHAWCNLSNTARPFKQRRD